jgi:hypothetical protein
MRYITEFKISPDVVAFRKSVDQRIEHHKEQAAFELGNLIASKIGFEEIPDEGKRFRLEVQAFSMKDWNEFKSGLKRYIESAEKTGLCNFNLIMIGKMLKALEEKGLPEPENKQQ